MVKFRISKVENGWIVEFQSFKYNFLGLHFCKVWKPYVKTNGLDESWVHSEKKFAIMNLISQVKQDTQGFYDYEKS